MIDKLSSGNHCSIPCHSKAKRTLSTDAGISIVCHYYHYMIETLRSLRVTIPICHSRLLDDNYDGEQADEGRISMIYFTNQRLRCFVTSV